MPHVKLAFLGFGNVGRALLRLWLDKRAELQDRYSIEWRVVGIGTRRHGAALGPDGIDPARALSLAEAGESLSGLSRLPPPSGGVEFVQACAADVLFESTPVNYADGQPAVAHLRAALEHGMHAVTANKGPVVHAFADLSARAAAHGRRFLFEAAVMDGAPLFSLWRSALPAARLLSFRGILNSTTNLILTRMEAGSSFDEALAQTQAIGVAETDPSGDVLGWDAAVKVAALTTVLMGHPLKPTEVERKGIEGITSEDVGEAARQGERWKLVCRAEREGSIVRASVRPERLDRRDPLYSVMGTSSAITFWSDVLGPLTLSETDPGPRATAYGMLADALNALRGV